MLEISQDNNRLQQYNAHKFKDIPSIFQSKLDMVLNFGKNQSLYPRIENPNEINDSIFNYSNSFNSDAEYQQKMSPGMESLFLSEVILLFLILFIWIASIYTFIRRYQLVLCFNGRDVPFYKSTVFNKIKDNVENNSLVPLTSLIDSKSTCDCSLLTESSMKFTVDNSDKSSVAYCNVKINNECETNNKDNACVETRNACKENKQLIVPSIQSNQQSNQESELSSNKIFKDISFDNIGTSNSSYYRSKERMPRNNTSADEISNYYYSNGLVYSSTMIKASSFLNKVTRNKKDKSNILARKSLVNLNKKSCPTVIQITDSDNSYIRNKRSLLNRKHANLTSLDETALNLYRKEHRLNTYQRELNRKKSPNSTDLQSKNLSTSNNQANREMKFGKAHVNFISLCHDDTVTKNWLRPNLGYNKSQNISEHENMNNEAVCNNKVVLREINPKSSIRRYMFINSRNSAMTEINPKHNSYNNEVSMESKDTYSISSESNGKINSENDNSNKNKAENLLNPDWIPNNVKKSLLDLHESVCLSKSDSNIKLKKVSNLLRPPSKPVKPSQSAHAKKQSFLKKKTLSLQIHADNYRSKIFNNNNSSLNTERIAILENPSSKSPYLSDSNDNSNVSPSLSRTHQNR